ncbi:hypothetical protein UACE39S_05477 [Ureibacillus acetophenoni]
MEKQILDLLITIQQDIKQIKTEMNTRFNAVVSKLEDIREHFELTNEARVKDVGFIEYKVNRLEKEIYLIKNSQ